MPLQVELRSPEGLAWQGQARTVVVPATKGSMGILPRHAPLTSSLEVGLTRVKEEGGKEHRFVTGQGIVEVVDDKVQILVGFAERPEQIDVKRAQEAHDRAKARLRSHDETVDMARAEVALARAIQRLRYAGEPRI
jgi:F-type H+-transporting ATPase subunit epsilon